MKIVMKKSSRELEAAVGDRSPVKAEQKEKARKAVVRRIAEATRRKRKAVEEKSGRGIEPGRRS